MVTSADLLQLSFGISASQANTPLRIALLHTRQNEELRVRGEALFGNQRKIQDACYVFAAIRAVPPSHEEENTKHQHDFLANGSTKKSGRQGHAESHFSVVAVWAGRAQEKERVEENMLLKFSK